VTEMPSSLTTAEELRVFLLNGPRDLAAIGLCCVFFNGINLALIANDPYGGQNADDSNNS
jgi:hypothetical protein